MFIYELFTESSSIWFHPLATSSQIDLFDENGSTERERNFSANEVTLISEIDLDDNEIVVDCTPNNENNMPARELSYISSRSKIDKEHEERFNRINFFLKNIKTSHTYMSAFMSILSIYPLSPINIDDRRKPIKYLCVAGNAFSIINGTNRF